MRIFSGVCTPHCLLNPADYPFIRFGSCAENVYHRPLTFDIDGNLRLCNHSPIIAGNIYQESLSDIFCSEYVGTWNDLNIPFCKTCKKLSACRGGCRAASEQTGLSLQHVDPVVSEKNLHPFI